MHGNLIETTHNSTTKLMSFVGENTQNNKTKITWIFFFCIKNIYRNMAKLKTKK